MRVFYNAFLSNVYIYSGSSTWAYSVFAAVTESLQRHHGIFKEKAKTPNKSNFL